MSEETSRPKLELSDARWREKLTPDEFDVLRRAGTERAFTGEYTDTTAEGVYECRACGAELFRSTEKFESHCGWPSFFDPTHTTRGFLVKTTSWGWGGTEGWWGGCHSLWA